MDTSLIRRQSPWFTIVGVLALVFILNHQAANRVTSAAPSKPAKQTEISRAKMSDEISMHAALGNPWINLSDGHELITSYAGPIELTQVLERNEARALSLCSADFDEDGVPDLISGYAGPNGGIITLLRGNVDSIYPNAPEAKRRKAEGAFTDAPFLSPAYTFAVPEATDYIGAGDFDGDSHWDVVTAKRGGCKLYLLSGNGLGELNVEKQIEMPGKVTALAVGEINRSDGLDDVVIGVVGPDGAKVLVFEGPEGALRTEPEVLAASGEVTSLALEQLKGNYCYDLAAAAGRELMLVEGRDRKLCVDAERRAEVAAPTIDRRKFDFEIRSMAVGDFSGGGTDIAVLAEDGQIHFIEGVNDGGIQKARMNRWNVDAPAQSRVSGSSHLVRARTTSLPVDNLVVVDSQAQRLQIISSMSSERQEVSSVPRNDRDTRWLSASIDVENGPATVLPMRLNSDALSDLVVMRMGANWPASLMTAAVQTFTVTNTSERGPGSLRQAVDDANASPGADEIRFNLSGAGPFAINVDDGFDCNESLVIDGTTQPGYDGKPIIELMGSNIFAIFRGSSTIRGFVLNRYTSTGIYIASSRNIIEGNYIGLNTDGSSELRAGFLIVPYVGVLVVRGKGNLIGGTSINARNTTIGVEIRSSSNNRVQGNYIGADAQGIKALGQGFFVADSDPGFSDPNKEETVSLNNTLGGTEPNSGNLIAGTENEIPTDGRVVVVGDNTQGTLIQGNLIGTNKDGTQRAAGKGSSGVVMSSSTNNTIGGTSPAARNVISGNDGDGINIGVRIKELDGTVLYSGGTGIQIISNYVGIDSTGNSPLGNAGHGVLFDVDTMDNLIQGNLIAFSGKAGLRIPNNDAPGVEITVQSNSIFSNTGLGIDLGEEGITPNDDKDLDGGANLQQNFPVLTSVTASIIDTSITERVSLVGEIIIGGTFNSTPNFTFTIQFFFGNNCQGSGSQFIGAIPVFLGSTQVMTDLNGNATFFFPFTFPSGAGSGFVNATATSAAGNTSEFSQCIELTSSTTAPSITNACKGEGKLLLILGSGFVDGAKVVINGEVEKKTQFVSSTQVIAFKAGKRTFTGDNLKVRNPDSRETPEFSYTRVNCPP